MRTLTVRDRAAVEEQRRRAERDVHRYPPRDRFDRRESAAAVIEALDIIEGEPRLDELDRLRRHFASEEDVIRRQRGTAVREGMIALTIAYYLGRTDQLPMPFA